MLPNDFKEADGENRRPPTEDEMKLFLALFNTSFQGLDELRTQVNFMKVRNIDGDGSLKLFSGGGLRAEVSRRIPVEAEVDDVDGVIIHLLLHVADGLLDELEIYREDSTPVRGQIDPTQLRVLVL